MPLQNRVSPFGELFAAPARGTMMGNRGGRLHDDARRLTRRRWSNRAWICCRLAFNDRHRAVWGDSYTELFFLDEVTAFAAGHRPCFECRRKDAEGFAVLFAGGPVISAQSRVSGNPALGPRFRGDEREGEPVHRATANEMDRLLHAERLDGRAKRLHAVGIDDLPDGAMIALGTDAFAVKGRQLLLWSPDGYLAREPRPSGIDVDLLTPPSIIAVLQRGYAPLWHPSAT